MDLIALIKAAGGVNCFAQRLGVSHVSICDWKRVGAIPPGRVVQVAKEFDLPIEVAAALSRQTPIKERAA